MSLKTLYLTPGCFDKGGISRYSRYQIQALRAIHGVEQVRVLSLMGPDPAGFEEPFETDWHGATSNPDFHSRVQFTLQALREMLVWQPDVIHGAHVNFTPLIYWLAKLTQAITVVNVYGLELWSGLSNARRKYLYRMDHVISDCHATADHLVSEGMHPHHPTVIWDCADLGRFHPSPSSSHLLERYGLPDPAHHRVLLTLGRLAVSARHKGYDRLLDVFFQVRERVPTAHLVFAGRGGDAERLEAKAMSLGLSQWVTFTGSIDEEDLPDLYRAAHVFALVSDKGPERGEGIPLTPIEAMACGLPVVVGDEDGSREAVDGGRNGIVVSPRDPAALIDALVTLLSETGTERQHRTGEARRVAEERFGYSAFVEKHHGFYSGIL